MDQREGLKIALFEPDALSIWLFRASLIKRLTALGHRVYVLCAPDDYVKSVESLGAVCRPIEMARNISPLKDIGLVANLFRIFREEKFDIVHTFTHKPNIYGAIVARVAGCPKVVESVTGLGVIFTYRRGFVWRCLRMVFYALSWVSFRLSDRACFFNKDILDRMVSLGLISRQKSIIIRGSGINLDVYSPKNVDPEAQERLRAELGWAHRTYIVMMVSRLLWGKGLVEFVQAAEMLYERCPLAKFVLVGPLEEEGHQGVPEAYLRQKLNDRFLWLGFREDIRNLIALADVVVLPSYGEGVPRSLLEAMAMAKPIVTTDTYGCREVVEDGRNGFLVPVKDATAVADAIERLLKDDRLRTIMGQFGRAKAEREFSEDLVVSQVVHELYGLT